ncbi:MAG TPA: cell division protein ZapA [Spirochaetota bacterium]|mgnify:CR=1 FL=1|nr:cell division protein ZapA [Spirochaetota bacterium]HOM38017.1 cell division protein ZapA [Spirochaetota bacterium]HPQ48821.1 cell division protein ZapA [Spirochaetota bacterium]
MEEKIEIEIFHTKFTLISNNREKTIKIAKFIDEKMKEIYNITGISSSLKLAILAALNIADELFTLKENSFGLKPNESDFIVNRIIGLTNRIKHILDNKIEE